MSATTSTLQPPDTYVSRLVRFQPLREQEPNTPSVNGNRAVTQAITILESAISLYSPMGRHSDLP